MVTRGSPSRLAQRGITSAAWRRKRAAAVAALPTEAVVRVFKRNSYECSTFAVMHCDVSFCFLRIKR